MTSSRNRSGIPVVISGPSGAGKTTLGRLVLDGASNMRESISYTTRPPRRGEEDGVHYHFIDDMRFDTMLADDGFLEWSNVHGFRYGTGRDWVNDQLSESRDILFVLDIHGGMELKRRINAVTIVLTPPNMASLKNRLERRGTDSPEVIRRRLSTANLEIEQGLDLYDYVVSNIKIESALHDVLSIIRTEHILRSDRSAIKSELLLTNNPL